MKLYSFECVAYFSNDPADCMRIGPFDVANKHDAKNAAIKILKQRGVYSLLKSDDSIKVISIQPISYSRLEEFDEDYI